MQVVSGPVGRERVHFEAPKADARAPPTGRRRVYSVLLSRRAGFNHRVDFAEAVAQLGQHVARVLS
jgi:hypothetical protein